MLLRLLAPSAPYGSRATTAPAVTRTGRSTPPSAARKRYAAEIYRITVGSLPGSRRSVPTQIRYIFLNGQRLACRVGFWRWTVPPLGGWLGRWERATDLGVGRGLLEAGGIEAVRLARLALVGLATGSRFSGRPSCLLAGWSVPPAGGLRRRRDCLLAGSRCGGGVGLSRLGTALVPRLVVRRPIRLLSFFIHRVRAGDGKG
jgi:hypothetical protein